MSVLILFLQETDLRPSAGSMFKGGAVGGLGWGRIRFQGTLLGEVENLTRKEKKIVREIFQLL